MQINPIHSWPHNYHEAVAVQNGLRDKLILRDDGLPEPIRIIAGADVSYDQADNLFFAAVILMDYASMNILETSSAVAETTFPYIPGLLSFREGPVLLAAFEQLHAIPDVIIFDGQGIAHPRGIGLASHLGLILNLPSIGCAKTLLCGNHGSVGDGKGAYAPLIFRDQICGAALRTRTNVKPVFVSPGHRISLASSLTVILSACRGYRLPEPVRKAHLEVNQIRREQEVHKMGRSV